MASKEKCQEQNGDVYMGLTPQHEHFKLFWFDDFENQSNSGGSTSWYAYTGYK